MQCPHAIQPKGTHFPYLLLLRRPHDQEGARQYAGDFQLFIEKGVQAFSVRIFYTAGGGVGA